MYKTKLGLLMMARLLLFFVPLILFCSEKIKLYIEWQPNLHQQEVVEPLISQMLAEKGYELEGFDYEQYVPILQKAAGWKKLFSFFSPEPLIEDVAYYIFWGVGQNVEKIDFRKLPKEKLILFTWEPPTTCKKIHSPSFFAHFHKVFTWNDELVDNKKFFKFCYPVLKPMREKLISFNKRKLCTLISSRLSSDYPNEIYSEREKAIRFFENNHLQDFDLYGRFWGKRKFSCYKGTVADKLAVMQNYKFCICFENTKNIQGYITEKIFDAFAVGCIPVYYGASNVEEYIPADCFIDFREFSSYDELYTYLTSITEEEFEKYLSNIKNYLESEKAKQFTKAFFYKNLEENLL